MPTGNAEAGRRPGSVHLGGLGGDGLELWSGEPVAGRLVVPAWLSLVAFTLFVAGWFVVAWPYIGPSWLALPAMAVLALGGAAILRLHKRFPPPGRYRYRITRLHAEQWRRSRSGAFRLRARAPFSALHSITITRGKSASAVEFWYDGGGEDLDWLLFAGLEPGTADAAYAIAREAGDAARAGRAIGEVDGR